MQIEATDYPNSWTAAKATGDKFYYTGKPCRHGNVALRLTSAAACWCEDCKRLHSGRVNSWQKRNPNKTLPRVSAWRAKNKDHIRGYRRDYRDQCRDKSRESHLERCYGMTIAEYNAILLSQEGNCALCKTPAESASRKRLFVDHCHDTGRIRGLLCDDCNKSLGVIEKFREKLDLMLHYADHASATSK